MKAIEFIAKECDGRITLPKKYVGTLSQSFRVIILVDESVKETKQKSEAPKKTVHAKKLNVAIEKTIKRHTHVFEKLAKN